MMPPPFPISSDDEGSDEDYVDSGESDVSEDEYPLYELSDEVFDELEVAADADFDMESENKDEDEDKIEEQDIMDLLRDCHAAAAVDSDDEEALFDGNANPPEYYLRNIENTNENDFKRKRYSVTTLRAIRYVKEQWMRYV